MSYLTEFKEILAEHPILNLNAANSFELGFTPLTIDGVLCVPDREHTPPASLGIEQRSISQAGGA